MISMYEIKNLNGEDVLYLYFNFDLELGEFFLKKDDFSFLESIKKFLKSKKVNYYGKKIAIVVAGILLCTLNFNDNPIKDNDDIISPLYVNSIIFEDFKEMPLVKQEEILKSETVKEKTKISYNKPNTNNKVNKNNMSTKKDVSEKSSVKKEVKDEIKITVHRENGSVINLNLEEYIIGVVGIEMPASFNEEALKAQAVVARTYVLNLLNKGKIITDTTSTQVYKSNLELKKMWGSSYNKYYKKVSNAVNSTKGVVIKYNGEYIEALYHSTSNGMTEDVSNVFRTSYPYLVSVDSSWDKNVKSYYKEKNFTYAYLENLFGMPFSNDDIVITKNKSGRVDKMIINNKTYTGVEIRNMLGLRSTDFTFLINEEEVIVSTKGYGHGVGMSQYGANEMAKMGKSYKQIINHYYKNVTISKI